MSISYKRSIITSVIFGTLLLFLVLLFTIIGPTNFLENRITLVTSSIVIAVSMIIFGTTMLLTNKKSNIVDERDYFIQRKASSIGLILSLIYVFLLSIILFVTYRNEQVINVSWLWFIAYSTFAFGYFITSLSHVYLYYCENH